MFVIRAVIRNLKYRQNIFPYKGPGIKLLQSPVITSQVLVVGCPAGHNSHGWSPAGVPSWRKADLKAPVCLLQAGTETLKKELFKQWLRQLSLQGTSSYLWLKKDRAEKSIVECEKESIMGVQWSSK